MTWVDPLVQTELVKLARELGVDEVEVGFLDVLAPAEIAALRRQAAHALFSPHEHRFRRMARAAAFVPPAIGGPGAQRVLPPLLAARGAAAMDPRVAVRLCRHLDVEYLVRLVPHLDPRRVSGIVAGLPDDLVMQLGELLVRRRDYVSLGRFVSHFPVETTLRLVSFARPLDLVRIALFADDHEQLGHAVATLPDDRVMAMLAETVGAGEADHAVAFVLAVIPALVRPRVVAVAGRLAAQERAALADAVRRVPVGASVPHAGTPEGRELLAALGAP